MVTAVRHTDLLRQAMQPFLSFFNGPYAELNEQPGIANFAVGNPHEMPLPPYVDAVRSHLEPHDPYWFAYKISEPNARATVAAIAVNAAVSITVMTFVLICLILHLLAS